MYETTETYAYDAEGNLLRKEWIQTHSHSIYEMTYDANNNLLTTVTTRNSEVVFTETNSTEYIRSNACQQTVQQSQQALLGYYFTLSLCITHDMLPYII